MWKDVLKVINRRHKLGVQFNESELSAKFPNGSVIYLVGSDSNEDERQKLLGQKFVLVVIDDPRIPSSLRARLHRHRRSQQAGSRGDAPTPRAAPDREAATA